MSLESLIKLLAEEIRKVERQVPERIIPPTTASAVDLIRSRAEHVFAAMQPRVELMDGRKGYRVRARVNFHIELGENPNERKVSETISMETDNAEIYIADPVMTLDGTLRVDLEIINFTLEGTSSKLFGSEERIRMHCGRYADSKSRPTFGRVVIPRGVEFGQVPVRVVHDVFVTVETPKGRLHNKKPALMMGYMTKFPPIGTVYEQVGEVDLFTEAGDFVGVKTTQTSELLENLG